MRFGFPARRNMYELSPVTSLPHTPPLPVRFDRSVGFHQHGLQHGMSFQGATLTKIDIYSKARLAYFEPFALQALSGRVLRMPLGIH